MKKPFVLITLLLLGVFTFACCNDDDKKPDPNIPDDDTAGFAKGADVSWVTEMEDQGVLFYDKAGTETECMALLKSLGMNSIRLRVWVNPVDGWCNKTDLLVKAKRANDLGHADHDRLSLQRLVGRSGEAKQTGSMGRFAFNDLCTAVSDHTTEILTALKNWNITPEWVQVGNETGNGMLWEDGKASMNMAQYATLNNAGYDAVKAVFPDAKVIVHLQNGQTNSLFRWLFDGLKNNGGKWDVIGMSLYPETDSWQNYNDNMHQQYERHDSPLRK